VRDLGKRLTRRCGGELIAHAGDGRRRADGPLGCPRPLSEPAFNGGAGTCYLRRVGGIFTVNRSLEAPYFTPDPAAWRPTSGQVATAGMPPSAFTSTPTRWITACAARAKLTGLNLDDRGDLAVMVLALRQLR
jgi:hypothetical protein